MLDKLTKNKELTTTDRLVYIAIIELSENNNICYVSNQEIGELIGISHKTVSKSISILNFFGYVKVQLNGPLRRIIINDITDTYPVERQTTPVESQTTPVESQTTPVESQTTDQESRSNGDTSTPVETDYTKSDSFMSSLDAMCNDINGTDWIDIIKNR